MAQRIYSLETEYALVHEKLGVDTSATRSTKELYALLEASLLAQMPYAVCDPTRSQARDGTDALIEVCEGYFLVNGARLYYDHSHLEWAAPETSDPYQAVLYDQVAVRELVAAAAEVERQLLSGRPMIVKNNLDYQTGATYGCHENYSIRLRSNAGRAVMPQILDCLAPYLVTRQIICGAGRLGASLPPHAVFQLAQRADFITDFSSVETRENRPIVNLRNEPLADGNAYARLHLILGDSNMCETSAFLKLGMTGILLDMIEADAPLPALALLAPEEALHQVSRDLTFQSRLRLAHGGAETAVGVQLAYWRAARDFVATQEDVESWVTLVIRMWGEVLAIIEQHRQNAESHLALDWAVKRGMMSEALRYAGTSWDEVALWEPVLARTWNLAVSSSPPPGGWGAWLSKKLARSDWDAIDKWRQEHRLAWDNYPRMRAIAAKLRAMDIRYHDIDPRWSLFHGWGAIGRMIKSDKELENARRQAPQDTRAAVRAQAIKLANERGESLRADWDRLRFVKANRDIRLPDPFSNDVSVLHWPFLIAPQPADAPKVSRAPKPDVPSRLGRDSCDDEIEIVILGVTDSPDEIL
jgi:hypothetical protein